MVADYVIDGIEAELEAASEYEEFIVRRVEQEGSVYKVFLSLDDRDGRLDESLEGAVAWWPGSPNGAADVLSVIPEEEQLNLRFVSSRLPGEGGKIRVYPTMYLQKLLDIWRRPGNGERFIGWWDMLDLESKRPGTSPQGIRLNADRFGWLRKAQQAAFRLVEWETGFLWGPPGTGKTTTLGAILAAFLTDYPEARVLLLATTNTAVDQALIAVDKCLAELTAGRPQPSGVRGVCKRIGNHFQASKYRNREHLLPVKDLSLVRRLAVLESQAPERSNVHAYQKWKSKDAAIRAKMRAQSRDVLDTARLAAMTTTMAAFAYDELIDSGTFDLVVFDEASQVGLAHAMALAALGKRALFAGDPKQLDPIVKSQDADAREWLGRSVFFKMREESPCTCLLDEQSRMADEICNVVSQTFYGGKLRVAESCRNDQEWKDARQAIDVLELGSRNAYLVETPHESTYSTRYGGRIRLGTAELIRDLIAELAPVIGEESILVLTPYRAQRSLIRAVLRNAGYNGVAVSTVHRAQGSERNTIIFDPVSASNPFLNNHDLGPRLMNVALSRAQARLFLIASRENLMNPVIERIALLLGSELPERRLAVGEVRRARSSVGSRDVFWRPYR